MSKSKNHSNPNKYIWREDKIIYKDKCFECDSIKDIHYHHVVPETLGGTKTIPLCIICHGKVHGSDFLKHKELQKIGIEKAKSEGKFIGRLKGTKEDKNTFLNKPKNLYAVELLDKGFNHIQVSKMSGLHVNTITKIRKFIKS